MQVTELEVVLANATVITVTPQSNPHLFKALMVHAHPHLEAFSLACACGATSGACHLSSKVHICAAYVSIIVNRKFPSIIANDEAVQGASTAFHMQIRNSQC